MSKIISFVILSIFIALSVYAEDKECSVSNLINNIDYVNIISIAKDFIFIIVAIITVIFAFKGFNAWKRQLKGKVEYELACRVLKTTYKLRDAIKRVRYPFIFAYEMEESSDTKDNKVTYKQDNYNGYYYTYKTRWKKVEDARADLYVELLESEVIWEEKLKECFSTAFKLEKELFRNIQRYLQLNNPDVDPEMKKDLKSEKCRNVMYHNMEEDDEFSKEYNDALEPIKNFLKSYLNKL